MTWANVFTDRLPQKKAARLVVGKGGHYIFGVKENQPKLWNAAVDAGDGIDLDHPEHATLLRAHGRIDRHRIWSAPVPSTITFPHAKTYLIVERESSTLDDVRVSIETRYYVTDLPRRRDHRAPVPARSRTLVD
jgi:hypothetical protein